MWIPGEIVDSMNQVFGSLLRRELIDLMSRSERLRARAASTGSQRLSLDSVGDPDDEDVGPVRNKAVFNKAFQ
jgi:hypothetical protein